MKQDLDEESKTQKFNIMDFTPGDPIKTVTKIKRKIKTRSGGAMIGFDEDTEGNNYGDFIAELVKKKKAEEM